MAGLAHGTDGARGGRTEGHGLRDGSAEELHADRAQKLSKGGGCSEHTKDALG